MITIPPEMFDIAEVARRTGLTSRALRFYEARGLIAPLRSASGRRYYGPAELERVHIILALKSVGLSIAQIARLTNEGMPDLKGLIAAQMTSLKQQAQEIAKAQRLLRTVQSRIDQGEPIDAATFCSLIKQGGKVVTQEIEAWAPIWDRYLSKQAQDDFAATIPIVECDVDMEAQAEQWKDLGSRIKAALPLDPESDQALAFVREWFTLLEPFSKIATPAMWEGTREMYANMDQWQGGDADPGFDAEVFGFIQMATTAARAQGKDIGPVPAWMQQQS